MLVGGPGHYGVIGKEECGLAGHPGHPGMAMSLEPNLHHLTGDPGVACNNFSVDSIMTTVSRDGSPERLDMAGAGATGPAWLAILETR